MPRRLLLRCVSGSTKGPGRMSIIMGGDSIYNGRTAVQRQRGVRYGAIRSLLHSYAGVPSPRRHYLSSALLTRHVSDVSVPSASAHNNEKQYSTAVRWQPRCFSTVSTPNQDDDDADSAAGVEGEKLRVAIVGAGAAGLSVALHLAPLVSQGNLCTVDVYEASPENAVHPHYSRSSPSASDVDENFHPGSGSTGRPIGVGIWSTALRPFARSGRPSHTKLLKQLELAGKYVGQVGYKTPEGKWLARSQLDEAGVDPTKDLADTDPSLLFLKEVDLLSALREAAKAEEKLGNIKMHYGSCNDGDGSTTVTAVSTHGDGLSGRLAFKDGTTTDAESPYHLIVSAEGMSSKLRSEYAGHNLRSVTEVSTGVSALGGKESEGGVTSEQREAWDERTQAKVNAIEDRRYTVFRGNSPLTDDEAGMDGISFQTWGVGRSMRFAAVGMSSSSSSEGSGSKKIEHQVWFATTNDRSIASVQDPDERRKLLADHFRSWHDPVSRLIESTPSKDILVERGVAHQHSTRPVLNLASIIEHVRRVEERSLAKEKGQAYREPSTPLNQGGPGPILLFVGDASMTVDPVLAQGFTIGMEAAADLAQTLQNCSGPDFAVDVPCADSTSGDKKLHALLFDPDKLREEIKARHHRRYGRMVSLLRATELVQTLAQPSGPFSGFLLKWLVRPAMRMAPNFAKKPIFDFMLRYSLGLTAGTEKQ
mmetsp:Transcript_26285/g.57683  ORF Transcript_26285/g.57683 Transcript_26285/m.57683 type:complete len:705 (+) Transcript_26285:164-2278(+)